MGPMYAGKTTDILKKLKKAKETSSILLQYSFDNRITDKSEVINHDKTYSFPSIRTKTISDVWPILTAYNLIGVDEGQFFQDLDRCEDLANAGKNVLISALSGDYNRESFKHVVDLLAKCDNVKMLEAWCDYCGKPAPFTLRLSQNSERILIGGKDIYRAVCRKCYFDYNER